MNLFQIICTACILFPILGQMLTDEENEERKRICGTMRLKSPYRRKVLNGVKASIKDAPWNVAIEVLVGEPAGLCTGSLVSPRHFITARHCFAELQNGGYKWNVGGEAVPGCGEGGSSSQLQNDVIVEQNFEDMVKVFVGMDCGYRKNCENKFTDVKIRKLILPRVCDDRTLDNEDLAIVELADSLNFTERIRPICVAHDDSDIFTEGVKMKVFGYGLNPANGNETAGPLSYEDVHATKCLATIRKTFCTESYSGKQLGCMGDSGSGVVRLIDRRVSLTGVLFKGAVCEANTRNEKDFVVNVAFYSDDICRHTGICKGKRSTDIKEEEKTGSTENGWEEHSDKTNKMLRTSEGFHANYRIICIITLILLSF